jgi:hypothetical protein
MPVSRATPTLSSLRGPQELALFCFIVTHPGERLLLEASVPHARTVCDRLDLYSNSSFTVAGGHPVTAAIRGSMAVTKSDDVFQTALNSPVFVEAWRHLLQEGAYSAFNWVVKLDSDAMVRSSLLRQMMWAHDATRAVLLTNPANPSDLAAFPLMRSRWLKHGMLLGAAEAFTAPAVRLLGQTLDACVASGNTTIMSEDGFVWWCAIHADISLEIVHTLAHDGGGSCSGRTQAALHPYKTAAAYLRCVQEAGEEDSPARLLSDSDRT